MNGYQARWILAGTLLLAATAGAGADGMRRLSIADAMRMAQDRNPTFQKANLKYESARLTYLKKLDGFGWKETFTTKFDYKSDESGDYKKNMYSDEVTEQTTIKKTRTLASTAAWNYKKTFAAGLQTELYSKFGSNEGKTDYRLLGPSDVLSDRSHYKYLTEKYNPEAGVNLTIPILGKDKNSMTSDQKLAASAWTQSQLDLEDAKRVLVLAVQQGYYGIIKARETTRLRKKVLVEAEERLDVTKKRLDVGLATELDVSQAELTLLRNRADLADAVFSEKQAFSQLDSKIGLPLDESFEPADSFPDPPATELSLKEIQTRAVSASTSLKKLDEDVEQASIKVDQAKNKLNPTLALTSNLALKSERRSLPMGIRDPEGKWALGLSYDFPFGDKTSEKADVKLAESTLGDKVIQRDETSDGLLLDATQRYQEITKLQQRREISRRAIAVARRALEISQAKYDEGRAEITDVIGARQSLVTSELDALNTVYSLAVEMAKLDNITGRSPF